MMRLLKSLNEIAAIRTWAMFLAGPPLLGFSGWLVWIVAFGGWPSNEASRQIDILGKALWISLALVGVVVVALAAAKVRGQGPGGSSFEIESGNTDRPPSETKATVTAEIKTGGN